MLAEGLDLLAAEGGALVGPPLCECLHIMIM